LDARWALDNEVRVANHFASQNSRDLGTSFPHTSLSRAD